MTAQGSSFSHGPLPLIHGVEFWVSGFFDLEQLVSPDYYLVYFKGAAVFLECEIPLCLDDFIVAPPYIMVTITSLLKLGLWPEATLSSAARGQHFLLEFLVCRIDSHLLSIWTNKTMPGCWLGTRVSNFLLWVTAGIWLIATLVGVIPPDLYHSLYHNLQCSPRSLQPICY